MNNFYDWLMHFKSVNLPIGDLAKDAEQDNNFPKSAQSKLEVLDYLKSNTASDAVIDTASNCFDFYKASHLQ